MLGARAVDGVEPDTAVRSHMCMAPVPRGYGACEGQAGPVLVVISDAVGKYHLCVVYGQVDDGECVRNGVGLEDVQDNSLISAYFVRAARVVCWCTL